MLILVDVITLPDCIIPVKASRKSILWMLPVCFRSLYPTTGTIILWKNPLFSSKSMLIPIDQVFGVMVLIKASDNLYFPYYPNNLLHRRKNCTNAKLWQVLGVYGVVWKFRERYVSGIKCWTYTNHIIFPEKRASSVLTTRPFLSSIDKQKRTVAKGQNAIT